MKRKSGKRRRRRQNRYGFAAVVLLACVLFFLFFINRWRIDLTVESEDFTRIEYRSSFENPGASAFVTGSILRTVRIPVPVKSEGSVDTNWLGTTFLTYRAEVLWMKAEKKIEVRVADTTPPVISLAHIEDFYTLPGQPYEEEGFEAVDDHDGDLTDQVTSEEKEGFVYYSVTDKSGNTGRAVREIFYDDREAPVITLEGGDAVTFYEGRTFRDAYSALDNVQGDMTDKVTVEGEVDTNTPGTYELTYTVTDDFDNTCKAVRTVTVKPLPKNPDKVLDQNKVIYLTFDDGPYQYTDRLLDILGRFNVKATFFVTGAYGYSDCIAREAREGHSIGVHTYTHDYASIYRSTDAFWSDFEKTESLIEQKTGKRTSLMRFPGGSSNQISRDYCPGIMTTLVRQAADKGLTYFDWNVESGDAGGTTSSAGVYQNIKDGVSRMGVSVVLCHDVKSYTVDAMEDTILWALENGYTFLPLTSSSPTAHHGVSN